MKTSIKLNLLNSITTYTTIDYLYKIGEPHKHETISRKLRDLASEKKIEPIFKGGTIIAYRKLNKYCKYKENNKCILKKNCELCLLNK